MVFWLGLSSTEGDRLGHLVRGVQMLSSYGQECNVEQLSDVVHVETGPGEPPAMVCLVGGTAEATREELIDICRETEWSLGESPATLSVTLFPDQEVFVSLRNGEIGPSATLVLRQEEFTRLCDWRQPLGGGLADWMGE